jgi:AcrR family transcriptional regulator
VKRPKRASKLPPKRERTRAQLVAAATRLLAARDPGDISISDVAAEAGMVHGTVYNYFRTRDEIVEAVALDLAGALSQRITADSRGVDDPADRVALGVRTFIRRAEGDHDWGRVLLRVSPPVSRSSALRTRVLTDVRAGRRLRRFRLQSDEVALDLIIGTTLAAMRTVLETHQAAGHDERIASVILRGLGMDGHSADRIAGAALSARVG